MIQNASFRNFKSLRHVDVEFERLTVFVGPNASGKTSILEGLHYLLRGSPAFVTQQFQGPRDPRLIFSRGVSEEEMQLACFGSKHALRLKVKRLSNVPVDRVVLGLPGPPRYEFRFEMKKLENEDSEWKNVESNSTFPDEFRESALLRLDARRLSQPSYIDRPTT